MIKINLATRKASAVAAGSGTSGGKGMSLGNVDMGALKGLPIKKILLPAVVCYAAEYALETYQADELAQVDAVIQKLSAEKVQLEAEANKMKGYEELKKSLDADEFTMRSKIDTIQKLIDERSVPPKLLLELSKAIPKEVWLTEFKIEHGEVTIKGASTNFQQISDFMKLLDENVLFKEVKTKGTQESKDDKGVDIKQFELSALRRTST